MSVSRRTRMVAAGLAVLATAGIVRLATSSAEASSDKDAPTTTTRVISTDGHQLSPDMPVDGAGPVIPQDYLVRQAVETERAMRSSDAAPEPNSR